MSSAVPVLEQSIAEPNFSCRLWEKAYDSLDGQLKTTLDETNTTKHDILKAVLQAAEEKRRVCLSKRWKFKRANGEEVILRDVLEKIARWINRFVAVGDTAVQFDPTAAALPWAAVRFLLLATTNDIQLFGEMVGDLEVIARLMVRYREFEVQHLQQSSAMREVLGEALASLYSEVLIYVGRAVVFFRDRVAVRIAKNMFRTADENNMQAILAKDDEVLKLARLIDTATLHTIEDTVRRMAYRLEESARVVEKKRYTQLLRWLSASSYPQHHQAVADGRPPDSGQWLLGHAEFQGWWNSSSSSILMLHGIAGAGKTHLCSVVVDTILKLTSSDPLAAPFAYFYCSSSCAYEPERARPDEVLRSLLRQLAVRRRDQPWVCDVLWSEYERRSAAAEVDGFELAPLKAEECMRLILELAMNDPVTIVVDALDEIRETDRHILLEVLKSIVSQAENVVKVFVTSRTSSSIMATLTDARTIRIGRKETRVDMEAFIRTLLDRVLSQKKLLGGQISPSLRTEIQEVLLDKAGEMFLWVELQMDQLCWLNHENDVLDMLRTEAIPKLDEMYENILNQILLSGKAAREVAIHVFSWTLYMCEPLTPQALLDAVSWPRGASDDADMSVPKLLRLCFNLVFVDVECNAIRFIHGSVQNFLRGQALFTAAESHRRLATACLETCKLDMPGELLSPVWPSETFYPYAVMYWPVHLQAALVTDKKDELFVLLLSFIFDGDVDSSLLFEQWLDSLESIVKSLPVYHPMWRFLSAVHSSSQSPLFVSAVFGIDGVLRHLATEDPTADRHWDDRNKQGHTALYLAATAGHTNTAAFLLERGAKVNIKCGKHGRPLFTACFNGHSGVMTLLLEHGASAADGTHPNGALNASFRGQQEQIALYLVQHAGVATTVADFEFAVRGAGELGFESVMQYLQKLPLFAPDKEVLDRNQARSAQAIRGGKLLILQRHLCTTDDQISNLPPDSVAMAVLYGHADVVRYLLDLGMSIEREGPFGPPLRTASLMNQPSIADLLLKRGARVDAGGPLGDALYVAAMKGHTAVVRLLLDHGASSRQQGAFYGNPLQAAAYFGHRQVVELLLASEMIAPSKTFAQGAFHAAAEGGHEDVLQCLLDKGYDFLYSIPRVGIAYACSVPSPSRPRPRRDYNGKAWTRHEADFAAVFAAASASRPCGPVEGNRTPAAILGYMEEDSIKYSHPLITGARAGQTSVVQSFLLQKEVSSGDYVEAAREAAKKNHLNVVRIFFEHAVPKELIRELIWTVFDEAQRAGHTEIADFALHFAASQGFSSEADKLRADPPRINRRRFVPACIERWRHGKRPAYHGQRSFADDRNIVHRTPNRGPQNAATNAASGNDYSALWAAVLRKIAAVPVVSWRLNCDARLTQDAVGRKRLLDGVLGQFVSDTSRTRFDETEAPDGHSLLTKSLDYVFETGPGAVLMTLLSEFPEEEAHDPRYGLVLQMAALAGQQEPIHLLLLRGADVNATGYYDGTALKAAARLGHDEVVHQLLVAGAADRISQGRWHTALEAAVASDKDTTVELLLQYGAAACIETHRLYKDRDLLQLAVKSNDDRIAQRLLAAGADTALTREKSESISLLLKLSIKRRNMLMVHALLRTGVSINGSPERSAFRRSLSNTLPLDVAAEYGHADIVHLLLEHGADPDCHRGNNHRTAFRDTPLLLAAKNGHHDAARALAVAGARLVPGVLISALSDADQRNDLRMIELLLDAAGARGQAEAVIDEAYSNYSQKLKRWTRDGAGSLSDRVWELLFAHAEPTADLLFQACATGTVSTVVRMLEQGIPADAQDKNGGCHALHISALILREDIVRLLLAHGADVNSMQAQVGTPLTAALRGYLAKLMLVEPQRYVHDPENLIAKLQPTGWHAKWEKCTLPDISHCEAITTLLLDAGADISLGCEDFGHPLCLAALIGSNSIVRQLLDRGASVHAQAGYWTTALFAAIEGGNSGVVSMLLQNGADLNQADEKLGTPLHHAYKIRVRDTVVRLVEHGALETAAERANRGRGKIDRHFARFYQYRPDDDDDDDDNDDNDCCTVISLYMKLSRIWTLLVRAQRFLFSWS